MFPERPEFDIYVSMDPAKEAGGMEGMKYKEYTFTLAENVMFGTERMLAART